MEYNISANSHSVVNSGITDDYKQALAEYIWNGFDAGASKVSIGYSADQFGCLTKLEVVDNGKGINFDNIKNTFGAFLDSQKQSSFQRTSAFKGRKGKGRFSFKAFSSSASWLTKWRDTSGHLIKFSVKVNASKLSKYSIGEIEDLGDSYDDTGTIVTFYDIDKLTAAQLEDNKFKDYLVQQYAWFLCLNKVSNFELNVNGTAIDYESLIAQKEERIFEIDGKTFSVTFIRWKRKIADKYYFYMMDESMHENFKELTSFNNNTIGFHHSLYVVSDYFNNFYYEKNAEPRLDGCPNQADSIYRKLLCELKIFLQSKEKEFVKNAAAEKMIEDYENEGVLPHFKSDPYSQMRKKDLLDTIKQIYTIQPRIFKSLKKEQKQTFVGFLNLLLDSSERDNVLTILEDIVKLTEEERTQLASILHSTSIRNLNRLVNVVHDRLVVIESLKMLVFDLKKFTTERNQIQKIVENNYWLFGESYQLVSADITMEKALTNYLAVLDGKPMSNEPEATSIDNPQSHRRPDIFMYRHKLDDNQDPSLSMEDQIIVELKRPNVNIGTTQYRQIEDYFAIIKKEDKFSSPTRIWHFYVVSSKIEEDVKAKYKAFEHFNKRYLVYKEDNYEIYAMAWDDVFQDFKLRNQYILGKLNFDAEQIKAEVETAKKDAEKSLELTKNILRLNEK